MGPEGQQQQENAAQEPTHLFHIWPKNPACGFESWKLARRAAAAASVELRFWLTSPAKVIPSEDCFPSPKKRRRLVSATFSNARGEEREKGGEGKGGGGGWFG